MESLGGAVLALLEASRCHQGYRKEWLAWHGERELTVLTLIQLCKQICRSD